jgi:hypothetical protein
MSENIVTRASLYASWIAAQRNAQISTGIHLNPASLAGLLLDQHPSASRALDDCPSGTPFWDIVRGYLLRVAVDEDDARVELRLVPQEGR